MVLGCVDRLFHDHHMKKGAQRQIADEKLSKENQMRDELMICAMLFL